MTTPHKPSCEHVSTVTVVAPYQVNLAGVVFSAGEVVEGVPNPTAEAWLANGWVVPTTAAKAKPPRR
jgi:hypothetical protein